jgi:hypothetical protein
VSQLHTERMIQRGRVVALAAILYSVLRDLLDDTLVMAVDAGGEVRVTPYEQG